MEGLLLGLLGSVVGIAIAPALSSFLIRHVVSDPTVDLPFSSQPDLRVFLFNFALALVVSLLFSMAPSFRFLCPDLVNSLKQQSGTATGGNLRFRRVSVGLQIGLSLLLLVGAGLFVQTLRHLRNVDVGFEREHLLSLPSTHNRPATRPKTSHLCVVTFCTRCRRCPVRVRLLLPLIPNSWAWKA